MGFFSWNTSDTGRSISNDSSDRPVFTVHMVTRDGKIFTEKSYEGYGIFGGKDFYELTAELNGKSDRNDGISLERSTGTPKLVERLPYHFDPGSRNWIIWFDSLPLSSRCEYQGFFYPSDEDQEFNESQDDYYR